MKFTNSKIINSLTIIFVFGLVAFFGKNVYAGTTSTFYNLVTDSTTQYSASSYHDIYQNGIAPLSQDIISGVVLNLRQVANFNSGGLTVALQEATTENGTYATVTSATFSFVDLNNMLTTTSQWFTIPFLTNYTTQTNKFYRINLIPAYGGNLSPRENLRVSISTSNQTLGWLVSYSNYFNYDLSGWLVTETGLNNITQPIIYFPQDAQTLTTNIVTLVGKCTVDQELPSIWEIYDYKVYGIISDNSDPARQFNFEGNCVNGIFNFSIQKPFWNSQNYTVFVWQFVTEVGGQTNNKYQVTSVGRSFNVDMPNNPTPIGGTVIYDTFGCQSYIATPINCMKLMLYEVFVPKKENFIEPMQDVKSLMDTKIPLLYVSQGATLLNTLWSATPSGNQLFAISFLLPINPKFGETAIIINSDGEEWLTTSPFWNTVNNVASALLWVGFLYWAVGRGFKLFGNV